MASFPQLVTQSRIVVEYHQNPAPKLDLNLSSSKVQPCLGLDFGQTEMAE